MGEEGLQAEILAQGVKDFYRLYLPLETQRYLFRILSAKLTQHLEISREINALLATAKTGK